VALANFSSLRRAMLSHSFRRRAPIIGRSSSIVFLVRAQMVANCFAVVEFRQMLLAVEQTG
jgi:hypothetical protein